MDSRHLLQQHWRQWLNLMWLTSPMNSRHLLQQHWGQRLTTSYQPHRWTPGILSNHTGGNGSPSSDRPWQRPPDVFFNTRVNGSPPNDQHRRRPPDFFSKNTRGNGSTPLIKLVDDLPASSPTTLGALTCPLVIHLTDGFPAPYPTMMETLVEGGYKSSIVHLTDSLKASLSTLSIQGVASHPFGHASTPPMAFRCGLRYLQHLCKSAPYHQCSL